MAAAVGAAAAVYSVGAAQLALLGRRADDAAAAAAWLGGPSDLPVLSKSLFKSRNNAQLAAQISKVALIGPN
jgi:hypothetical protein